MSQIIQKLYSSRRFRNGDEVEIVDLYNSFTGRNRSVEAHVWQWLETPYGHGDMWVITEQKTGSIVGHHGLIPLPLSYGGELMLMGKTENTFIHQDHSGKVLYFLYEKEFIKEAAERFDLLFTTQGSGGPGRIRRKLGYVEVNSYTEYVRITQKQAINRMIEQTIGLLVGSAPLTTIIASPLKLVAQASSPLWADRTPRSVRGVELRRIASIQPLAEDLDLLWAESKKHYPITIDRNSDYLKWRIFDNPNIEYEFFAAYELQTLVGYVVVEIIAETARIVDLIVTQNRQDYFDEVLQAVTSYLRAYPIDRITFRTLYGSSDLQRALSRNGYYPFAALKRQFIGKHNGSTQETPVLLVKAIHPDIDVAKLQDANNWYYTDLFAEGRSRE